MKANDDYVLNNENYYSDESNKRFMSVHQYLSFAGHMGVRGCEAKAMEILNGNWVDKTTDAMLVGSYVDSYFEGSLDEFKKNHPEVFKKDGTLYAKYEMAEKMIARCEEDDYFMATLGFTKNEAGEWESTGEKQRIMTAYLFGCDWKIKMDSYIPDVAIVDLKTTSDLHKAWRVENQGYVSVPEYWGYILQGAIYQKVVEINTGKKLPFYLSFVTKDEEPELSVAYIDQQSLDHALEEIMENMPAILEVKNGKQAPMRCEKCNYCKRTAKLNGPIHYLDLISE